MQFFEGLSTHPSIAGFRSRAAAYVRQFRLDRALRAAIATRSGPIADDTVAEICETWGDPGLTASDGYLRALLLEAQKAHGHILQCGADLTTLLTAIVVERRGVRLWTLENSTHTANALRSWLTQYGLTQTHVIGTPLDLTDAGVGYSLDTERLPGPFSLVVCEASNAHPGSARRLLPRMEGRLHANAVALVRNVRKRRDLDYLAQWSRDNSASFVVKGKTEPFAKIVLRNQASAASHTEARINTAFGRR